ncbi:MAG: hypothetical protein OM95_06860 [Bdellovibrio sp. ArHS]|uniref:hypothetical protein n=1 Tax=Bdellovibrio sp. ArHS TaxID=1569284 RepID=UPI000582BFFD|nr:hypothetical protein [Bdellovibrio sp. ArHS]KHD88830.1 MAG: hypothetical protein OM95_06860 [Bdellovibrio sp. ArHS]
MASEVRQPKGFTDEEMEAIEAQESAGFTDDEIEALEASVYDKYPAWRSALAGAEDTALMGYGPNVRAAISTGSFSSPEYISERDRINAENKAMKEEDPGSFLAGQVGGGAATLAIPGGAALKAGKLATRLGRAAMIGAGLGAAADTPDVEGQVTSPLSSEDLKERGANVAMGAAVGPVAELGVSTIKAVTPDELARAFSALQPGKAARRNVRLAEESGALSTKKNIIGFAKEEGMLDGLPGSKDLYDRALASKSKYGDALDKIYRRAQEVMDNLIASGNPTATPPMKNIDSIKSQVLQEIKTKKWADADKDAALKQLGDYFESLKSEIGPDPNLLQLHDIKSSIGSKSFKESRAELPTSTEEFWRTAGRIVDDEIKQRVDSLATLAGRSRDKELGAALREANRRYSLSSDIYSMAADAVDSAAGRLPRDPGDVFGSVLRAPELQVGLSKVGRVNEAIPQMLKPSGPVVANTIQQTINDATRLPTPNEIYQQRMPMPMSNIEKAKRRNEQIKMQKQMLGQ